MPSALWTLIWLNIRAVLRRTGRQLKTWRGAIFALIGVGMLTMWIGPSLFFNRHLPPPNPKPAMQTAPVVLLVLCLLNLFTSAGERAVTFTPAEIDFLFPGPFSRRQLLVYKMVKTALAGIASALLFSVAVNRLGGNYFCRVIGVWLVFQFLQLLAMIVALVQSIVGERLMATGRRWGLAVLGVLAGVALWELYRVQHEIDPMALLQLRDTMVGRMVLAPFNIFAHVMVAKRLLVDGIYWVGLAAVIDLALAGIVIGLDANYLETSATASARRYDRLARVRRSGVAGLATAGSSRVRIGVLPWLGGVGPILWRQLTTLLRTSRTLLIILIGGAVIAGVAIATKMPPQRGLGLAIGVTAYINLFLSQMLKFDFRGDLDQMDLLRSLPLRPVAVTAAQVCTPALTLSVVQLSLFLSMAIAGHLPAKYLLAALAFVLPLNLLTVSVDNVLFLIFPIRMQNNVAGDMSLVGRQSIVMVCRVLVILLAGAIAAGCGAAAWFMEHSRVEAALSAWFPLLGAVALFIFLGGVVFNRFDPSAASQ